MISVNTPLKVYIQYDGDASSGREALKLKTTLPAKWCEEPCEKVLQLFVNNYNKKYPSNEMQLGDMYIAIGSVRIPLDEPIGKHIREYADLFVLHQPKADSNNKAVIDGLFTCTNYGCGKKYREEENHDTACHYHSGGPVFWDTAKYWSCCSEIKKYEFDDFAKIEPCMVGRHDCTPKDVFKKLQSTQQIMNTPLNPEQVLASASASPATNEPPNSSTRVCGPRPLEESANQPQEIVDGKARCRNFGCAQIFSVNENHDTACHYHSGGPVFWDTAKYWSCCSEIKKYEFDDFAKIPGCCVGAHKL